MVAEGCHNSFFDSSLVFQSEDWRGLHIYSTRTRFRSVKSVALPGLKVRHQVATFFKGPK